MPTPLEVMNGYVAPAIKNQDGRLGPICGYCGGYGFTNSMKMNESSGCQRCRQTGIEPPDIYQLARDVTDMKAAITEILRAVTHG